MSRVLPALLACLAWLLASTVGPAPTQARPLPGMSTGAPAPVAGLEVAAEDRCGAEDGEEDGEVGAAQGSDAPVLQRPWSGGDATARSGPLGAHGARTRTSPAAVAAHAPRGPPAPFAP